MMHLEFDLEYSRMIVFNVVGIFLLVVLTPSPLESNAWGCKLILLLSKWSWCLPELYYCGRDLIIEIFLNGEISWPVFKVITQSSRYIMKFYFSFIVIFRIYANIAVSVAQMIVASRNFFHWRWSGNLVGMFI